jgi:thiosulfate reductase/polysulfide reductase chain A
LAIDPETGCNGMRNNFVKLVKDGKVLDIPA